MASAIYTLCAVTAFACAFLLLRSYARTRFRLLLWSGLCFAGLCANNVLLILDRYVFLAVDLSVARQAVAFVSVALLVVGLVLESDA
ncbi:MAG TPA: DUF5985 family protein [Burkholderiaceae bacterium]